MPGYDHTGPNAKGAMTGHGGGWCAVPADQAGPVGCCSGRNAGKRRHMAKKSNSRKRLHSCWSDRGKKVQ